jgi:hypothetical protein
MPRVKRLGGSKKLALLLGAAAVILAVLATAAIRAILGSTRKSLPSNGNKSGGSDTGPAILTPTLKQQHPSHPQIHIASDKAAASNHGDDEAQFASAIQALEDRALESRLANASSDNNATSNAGNDDTNISDDSKGAKGQRLRPRAPMIKPESVSDEQWQAALRALDKLTRLLLPWGQPGTSMPLSRGWGSDAALPPLPSSSLAPSSSSASSSPVAASSLALPSSSPNARADKGEAWRQRDHNHGLTEDYYSPRPHGTEHIVVFTMPSRNFYIVHPSPADNDDLSNEEEEEETESPELIDRLLYGNT